MYMSIDFGTSGIKAILMKQKRTFLAGSDDELHPARVLDGWSEQDLSDWNVTVAPDLGVLTAKADFSAVKSFELLGLMQGRAVLEAFAQCLRPCIFWNDNRANANAVKIYGSVFFRQTTGNIVFPWLIVSKLFLIKHDKPNLFDGVSGTFLRKNHPHPRLRAEPVPEMSRAAGTSWFYVILRRWSDDLFTAIGLGGTDMSHLISVCEQSDAVRLSFMQRKIG